MSVAIDTSSQCDKHACAFSAGTNANVRGGLGTNILKMIHSPKKKMRHISNTQILIILYSREKEYGKLMLSVKEMSESRNSRLEPYATGLGTENRQT